MSVSVVIPLYNKALYVRRALDSVFGQTYGDFEIIVVDDGSTDGGPEIVSHYRDPRLRLIRQENAGPAHARNRGLEEAESPWVTFLDADDEWMPEFLETSLRVAQQHAPEVSAVSSAYIIKPTYGSTEPLWRRRGLKEGLYRLDPSMDPAIVVHLTALMCPWNTVARTDAVRRWGGFCPHGKCLYGEDSYLWLKFLLNEPVAVSMEPLVLYHTEASGLAFGKRGPRPIEPILQYPDDLYDVCSPRLAKLLGDVLAIRAAKTACVLSYWGQWRQARQLLKAFCPWSSWRLPFVGIASVCATPPGALAGYAARSATSAAALLPSL